MAAQLQTVNEHCETAHGRKKMDSIAPALFLNAR